MNFANFQNQFANFSRISESFLGTKWPDLAKLWHNIISLWQCRDSLFSIWQNYKPTLVNFLFFWSNINCCTGPKFERISHLVTLLGSHYYYDVDAEPSVSKIDWKVGKNWRIFNVFESCFLSLWKFRRISEKIGKKFGKRYF